MGSMALDKDGNIALGYSVSGTNVYPSIRYTGRAPGDPPGTLTLVETSIIEGTGAQTHSSGRWGDYSAMAVDPVDDCTFWYTTEYYSATSSAGWKTRIASFKFASCAGAPPPSGADLSITNTDSPDPVVVGDTLTYTIAVTNNGPETATNVVVTDTLPWSVSLVSAPACSGSGPLTCAAGTLANGDTATITITVTPNSAGPIANSASASATETDPNTANNTATATTTVNPLPPPPGSAPVVSACNPNIGSRNQQLLVQVTGSNFQSGATVGFGSQVMVQGITFVNSGQLNVQVKVHPKAATGLRTVTVTNTDGQSGSNAGCFTVN